MNEALAVFALLISLMALFVSWANYRSEHTNLVIALRNDWEALSPDWNRAIILHRGWDDVYSTSSLKERHEVRVLTKLIRQTKRHSLSYRLAALAAERSRLERLRRYFYSASELALSGRISIKELYGIFGPDFARHRELLAWLIGDDEENSDYSSEDEWISLRDQLIVRPFHQEARQLRLLHSLVWAECVSRGDTYSHLMIEHANWLRHSPHKLQWNALNLLWRQNRFLVYPAWAWHLRKATSVPISSLQRGGQLLGRTELSCIAWRLPRHLKVALLKRLRLVDADYQWFV